MTQQQIWPRTLSPTASHRDVTDSLNQVIKTYGRSAEVIGPAFTGAVWRFADRVVVGAAVTTPDTAGGGNTFVSDTSNLNSQWIERSATTLSVAPGGGIGIAGASRHSDTYTYLGYSVWVSGASVSTGAQRGYNQKLYVAASSGTTGATGPSHTVGTVSDGAVDWTFVDYTYQTPIAVVGIMMNDISDGDTGAWANYFEAQRGSGAGTTFAMEVDVKNKGSDVLTDPYDHLHPGATIGTWFAGGGDSTLGAPTNPSSAAITIGKNATTWNKGIVFEDNGLTADGSGNMIAIAMAEKQRLVWYVSAGNEGAAIKSSVVTASKRSDLVFFDDAVYVLARSATMGAFANAAGAAPVNYPYFTSTATGNPPTVEARGSDTDIDLKFIPQGAGLVRFGAHTGLGAEALSGYITIKDAGGTSRKLGVIS